MRRRAGGVGRGACARDSQPRSREASGNCPPDYEGRPVRAHGDRMNGGVSRRDQGEREFAAGFLSETVPRAKNRRDGASAGDAPPLWAPRRSCLRRSNPPADEA